MRNAVLSQRLSCKSTITVKVFLMYRKSDHVRDAVPSPRAARGASLGLRRGPRPLLLALWTAGGRSARCLSPRRWLCRLRGAPTHGEACPRASMAQVSAPYLKPGGETSSRPSHPSDVSQRAVHARSAGGRKSPLTKRHTSSSQFGPPIEFGPKLQRKKKVVTSIFRALGTSDSKDVLRG